MSKKMNLFSIIILGLLNMKLTSCVIIDPTKPFPATFANNINIFNAKPVKTQTPLVFADNPIQVSRAYNTGSSLFFATLETEKTQLLGGIFNHTIYNFFQIEYFWDLDLKFEAGNKINGIGSPVQAVFTYFNTKYGNVETALTKEDGIVQGVLFIYVAPFPNPLFYPFQVLVQSVKGPNTSKIFFQYFAYNWFFVPSITQHYYIMKGSYTNSKFNKKYKKPIVIFLIRVPIPYISYEQFNSTFGSMRNNAGQRYSNKMTFYPDEQHSLERAFGTLLTFK